MTGPMFDDNNDDPFKSTVESKAEKAKPKKEKPMTKDVEITTEQADENGQFSTTIRYGASYDAPMDNLKTSSLEETDAFLNSDAFKQHVNLIFGVWQGLRKKAEDLGLENAEQPAKAASGGAAAKSPGKRPNPPGIPEIECDGGHGVRNYFNSPKGWEALFCAAAEKSDQCPPLFKNKKTGEFEAN